MTENTTETSTSAGENTEKAKSEEGLFPSALSSRLNAYMLRAPSAREPNKRLTLTWGVNSGYPCIYMDTDDQGERSRENNWNRLQARMNGSTFMSLMTFLEEAANTSDNSFKRVVSNYHTMDSAGNRHEEPIHRNDVIIGRDDRGVVWITVLEEGRNSVRFFILPDEFVQFKDADKKPYTDMAFLSKMSVLALTTGLRTSIGAMMAFQQTLLAAGASQRYKSDLLDNANAATPQRQPWQNRQQGGGGGGWQRGGGGGWQNRQGGGGGGWQNRQGGGGGGGWQNRQGGGGGWQNRQQGNGGGGWQNREQSQAPAGGGEGAGAPAAKADDFSF